MSKVWKSVGNFLKENKQQGVALVGSLLTGNVPGAIAAGVSMVAQATGTDDPVEALQVLQQDPATMVRLKEIALEREKEINRHLEEMTRLDMEDEQRAHEQTQLTIRAGDSSDNKFVAFTRPGQSWISLIAALAYAFRPEPNWEVLGLLLTLPFAYAGLRQWGKNKHSDSMARILGGSKK